MFKNGIEVKHMYHRGLGGLCDLATLGHLLNMSQQLFHDNWCVRALPGKHKTQTNAGSILVQHRRRWKVVSYLQSMLHLHSAARFACKPLFVRDPSIAML